MPLRPEEISPLSHSYPEDLDYARQGVEAPGTRRPGQTGHFRQGIWGLIKLEDQPYVRTLPDLFQHGLELGPDAHCLGHRPVISTNPLKFANHYEWQTYAQIDERRRNLGSALRKLFNDGVIGGGEMPTVGTWSQNRPEWQVIDLSLHLYGFIGISLYDTFGKDSVEYVINHAEMSVIFATAQHIPTLLALRPKIPRVRMIVVIDDLPEDPKRILTAWGNMQNIQVKEMRELEEFGKQNRIQPVTSQPDDIATICYTSGTTGNPKGALLSHRNLVSATQANLHGALYGERGLLISYLPLAHIYERITELAILTGGGAIGSYTGDPLRLLEDCQILKPNFFPSVPRVLNRIYQAAMQAAVAPGLKGFLFRSAMEAKVKRLRETGSNVHLFWDKLVFRKVRAVLGGNVLLMTSGSAPIGTSAMDFLRVAFAGDMIEGYGMTENCGTCTRVWPNDPTSTGFVGAPQPCNELKLLDVPTMSYTSLDKPFPRGEICVRGDNCFVGYYKDAKATAEALDAEGWLHTGDVGTFDACGRLRIIDRVKNIMKLSQGEYVALEKIENTYMMCAGVAQVYVHGDSLRDHLVGIVVPEPVQFAELAGRVLGTSVRAEDAGALARASRDAKVVSAVLGELEKEAAKAGLKGFERIKRIHVTMDPFTTENGMLTPTFKLRRKDVQAAYKDVLAALYDDSPASGSGPSSTELKPKPIAKL